MGKKVLFRLGQVLATPGALEVLNPHPNLAFKLLALHVTGDWGDLCPEDEAANNLALESGERVLSAYLTPDGQRVWIITEWDRSATTILLPEEY